jgi:hypothetical protein
MPDTFSCWRRRKARRTCEQAQQRLPHSRPRRSPSPAPRVGNKKPTQNNPPKNQLKMFFFGFFSFFLVFLNFYFLLK